MANITDVKLPDNSQYDLKDNVSGYASKVSSATTDDLASLTATGDLADSGKKLSDLVLKSDVKDVLNSTSTTDPLSANQGKVLADNLAANENVYGAKNRLPYPWYETTKSANGLTFTDNGDGTLTLGTGTASADTYFEFCRRFDYTVFLQNGTYLCTGCPQGVPVGVSISNLNADSVNIYSDTGNGVEMPINGTALGNTGSYVGMGVEVKNGTVISTPITFKPMIRDARIIDDTFAPYAETNLQLTRKTSGLSNENLLDNPWFTVNQRGATTVTSGYGADRWKYIGGNEAVFSPNGVTLNSVLISQVFEKQLPNGVYTASALFYDGTIRKGTATKSDNTSSVMFIDDADFKLLYVPSLQRFDINTASLSSGLTVRAVKLELGTVSTLANDVAPNYTTELLKCQRYYFRNTSTGNYAHIAIGTAMSTTTVYIVLPIPVPMRTTPTFAYAGSLSFMTNGQDVSVTNVTAYPRTDHTCLLVLDLASSVTAGVSGSVNFSTSGSYYDLSADL